MAGRDAGGVLRGALRVAAEVRRQADAKARYRWATSSLTAPLRTPSAPRQEGAAPRQQGVPLTPSEVAERVGVVVRGVSAYVRAPAAHTSHSYTTHTAHTTPRDNNTHTAHGSSANVASTYHSANSTPSSSSATAEAHQQYQQETPVNVNQDMKPTSENQPPNSYFNSNLNKIPGETISTNNNENNYSLPHVPSSFSQMKQSKRFAPIMDPTVPEVDLEKLLGLGPRKYNNPPKPSSKSSDFSQSSNVNDIVQNALKAADEAKSQAEVAMRHASNAGRHVSEALSDKAALTEEDTAAIEASLDSIHGLAMGADFSATLETASQYPADLSGSINEALKSPPPRPYLETVTKASAPKEESVAKPPPKLLPRKPIATKKAATLLSKSSHARKVPESRLGRAASFGKLFAELGVGTAAEALRRGVLGRGAGQGALSDSYVVLTEANANRIVDALCKVRGAALKLGQMASFSDASILSPELQRIFERVRQSADHMPLRQLSRVLTQELGKEWRDGFATFDDKPFAAASIGQVHSGELHDGRRVAVKVQYPGVFEGIESDIDNLTMLLGVVNLLPETFYIDNIMEVAKRELSWECDYERERECGERYRALLAPYPLYYVPATVPHLSTARVLTTELVEGTPVDQCTSLDQDTRDHICRLMLELTLRELFEFGFMQTDPNWGNFLYNSDTRQLVLLDCGACREFDAGFVAQYIEIIHGAATDDRAKVTRYSKDIGFLTGLEDKVMVAAHVDSVMILGEAFRSKGAFSFARSNTSQRVQEHVPTMVARRMCPPPEQVYSLHRKMSGVFLLCARLGGCVDVSPLFFSLYDQFKAKQIDETFKTDTRAIN